MDRRNGMTVSFRILQEYDNLWNGGTHCDWPERNPDPNPMPNPNPTLALKITVIYAVQLPNVFRKLIVTFRHVPWIILFNI